MTGRPGDRTMEMNGRSTASYLAHAPRVSLFLLVLIGLEAKGLLDLQGRRGITSVVRWSLRPVICGGVETSVVSYLLAWARSSYEVHIFKDPVILKYYSHITSHRWWEKNTTVVK